MRQMARQSSLAIVFFTVALASLGSSQAADLSGQVSQNEPSPDAFSKTLTVTPGYGQFSANRLQHNKEVALTLYNPNPYPMRFETTERRGKEYSWLVPANGQMRVSFINNRYFNREIKFVAYQEPTSLLITEGKVSQPVVAVEPTLLQPAQPTASGLIGPVAPMASQPAPSEPVQAAQAPSPRQSQSAVRGYW